jgi:hypothetical protein
MPFRYFAVWANTFSVGTAWTDGLSASERTREYNEIYGLTQYLLTNYNNSGKSFYLGHWEGDWYLLPGYDTRTNPSPTRIQGMIDWLNVRQQAVDDALRMVTHTNVAVYQYTEVNRVRDAMFNGPANNQRLVNAVLPFVTNIDFVSWSSYDGQNLNATDLTTTLNYIVAQTPTNKAAQIFGRRLFVGEYGWGKTYDSAGQEPVTRAYVQKLLGWGVRFALFWEMYNNEAGNQFWLIDSNAVKTPCYYLHQRFYNAARLAVARFQETHGRLPNDAEFGAAVSGLLDAPLAPPVPLTLQNLGVDDFDGTNLTAYGQLTQGVYGDDEATVWVYWGATDGGTNRAAWSGHALVGTNLWFNPTTFAGTLTNLAPNAGYFVRFYASNQNSQAWAPSSLAFRTDVLNPAQYAARMQIQFAGYTRAQPLADFPALVTFAAGQPGFAYRQFYSANAGDLRFTDAGGRRLIDYAVDDWDTNGTSHVWVRVPVLQNTNTCVWAYWGNPLAATPPAGSTNGAFWSRDHLLVWHLGEAGLPYADSAGQFPAATGNAPASTDGVVGRGVSFNGTNQYLSAGPVNLGDVFTFSAWVKPDASSTNIQTLWANKSSGYNSAGVGWFINSFQSRDGKTLLETGNGADGARAESNPNVAGVGAWQLLAATVNRTNGVAHLFVNGVEQTALSAIRADFVTDAELRLGEFTNGAFPLRGAVDEARVARGEQSADWLQASYAAVADPAFTTNSVTPAALPVITTQRPANGWQLAWPGYAHYFRLYAATNLTPPVTWLPTTNAVLLVGDIWQTTVPILQTGRAFFRLQAE